MFKSIQWKIISLFMLLSLSLVIFVGTFLMNSLLDYYHERFYTTIASNTFINDLTTSLNDTLNTPDPVERIKELLNAYSIQLGIDSYRNIYILDGKNAQVLYSSDDSTSIEPSITQNILSALNGQRGDSIQKNSSFLDFALPLVKDGKTAYIVYIKDTKVELYDIVQEIAKNILLALVFGFIVALFLGLILSRNIIAPLKRLQARAEKMASGDFEHAIEIKADDEIGRLTRSFNFMASELKETLLKVENEKNKISTILLYMTDGVIAFDADGTLIHINPAAQVMLSVPMEEATKPFDEFFKDLNIDISLNYLFYLDRKINIEKDITINDRHIKAYFAAFEVEENTPGGVVVVLQDITEQEKLEKSRREFVANVSHELRTPLATIKSYSETLIENLDKDKDSFVVNFLKVIEKEADRMTRLVRDLLTLSRLDYNKNALKKVKFDLVQLVDEVVKKFQMTYKSHTIIFEVESEIPAFLGDKDKIEQVITNIISNAIKYSYENSKVIVKCGYRLTDAYIKVIDFGIGIPKEDLARIFERFYRVDKARSRETGGTGLGLSIAKEIVELHNGKITIESEYKKGTEVLITMPIYSG